MAKYTFTQEEQEIFDAFESENIHPIPNAIEEIEKHKKYAVNTLKQDKKINIYIANRDFFVIQKLALSEGISYQTFVAGILHKFAESNRQSV
ncbi:antitoxin [Thiotrichales bacterium HSG1]|nr:antitoxin [Thiotrichales bacterium HSG1]